MSWQEPEAHFRVYRHQQGGRTSTPWLSPKPHTVMKTHGMTAPHLTLDSNSTPQWLTRMSLQVRKTRFKLLQGRDIKNIHSCAGRTHFSSVTMSRVPKSKIRWDKSCCYWLYMGLESYWNNQQDPLRRQHYDHCCITFLWNCWLLFLPVIFVVLLNSSFSTPKLRNPFETRRKAEEMLPVQPSTYLKCYKHFFSLLSGLEAQHPHTGNPNSEAVNSPYSNPTEGKWADSIPSMGLGTKCDEGLVFFTRFPFIIWPSLLSPRNHARPDSCCRYSVEE